MAPGPRLALGECLEKTAICVCVCLISHMGQCLPLVQTVHLLLTLKQLLPSLPACLRNLYSLQLCTLLRHFKFIDFGPFLGRLQAHL